MAEFQFGTLPTNSSPVVVTNFVGDSDTTDTYSFNLASSGNINLALTGMSADADVKIYRDFNGDGIINGNDNQIGSSTRGSSSDDSINIGNADAGSYIVDVYRFSGNTNYDLRLSTNGSSQASNLLLTEFEVGTLDTSRNFTDSVGNSDTTDVYDFNVNQAGNYRFNLSGLNSADADLRLVQDSNRNLIVDPGEVIASSISGGTTFDSITNYLSPGDNYFVEVYRFSTSADSISYNLNMTPL